MPRARALMSGFDGMFGGTFHVGTKKSFDLPDPSDTGWFWMQRTPGMYPLESESVPFGEAQRLVGDEWPRATFGYYSVNKEYVWAIEDEKMFAGMQIVARWRRS